jgi:hypothetical protein
MFLVGMENKNRFVIIDLSSYTSISALTLCYNLRDMYSFIILFSIIFQHRDRSALFKYLL